MGSPVTERDRGDDEKPHRAEVSAFAICRTEVTLGQWQAVMGTRPNDCAFGCEDAHPVQKVSWVDAVGCLNRLTDLENETRGTGDKLTPCYQESATKEWSWERGCTGYRLQTEAEWEYAARAGTETAYSFGASKEACAYANGAERSAKRKHAGCDGERGVRRRVCGACAGGAAQAESVVPPRHARERVGVGVDRSGEYPEAPAKDYAGPDSGLGRVWRGGSFNYVPGRLRSSYRLRVEPTDADVIIGFRCARGSRPSP